MEKLNGNFGPASIDLRTEWLIRGNNQYMRALEGLDLRSLAASIIAMSIDQLYSFQSQIIAADV